MDRFKREVKRVRRYHDWGYEVRDEVWSGTGVGPPTLMKRQAYNLQGEWIGESHFAYRLFHKRGIYPEKSDPEHCVCSIGFSEKLQKWFGWSHRAICGFSIGDRIFEEKYGDESTPFIEHGMVSITTMEQARLAAENFAASVS